MLNNLSIIYLIISIIAMLVSIIIIKKGLNIPNNLIKQGKEIDAQSNTLSSTYILVGSMAFSISGGLITNIMAFDAMK